MPPPAAIRHAGRGGPPDQQASSPPRPHSRPPSIVGTRSDIPARTAVSPTSLFQPPPHTRRPTAYPKVGFVPASAAILHGAKMMTGGELVGIDGDVYDSRTYDAYKRAVYRRAPPRFTVDVLPSTKHGGNYSYGLRIVPLGADTDVPTPATPSTSISHIPYEIWRRWEDCLLFQDTLEDEMRARRGGSLDSALTGLPSPARSRPTSTSPEPTLVLPRLTKRGTLFRASQATVGQRHAEFTALMRALFDAHAPPQVRALRAVRVVHDFFGFWRRDQDRAEKEKAARARAGGSTSTETDVNAEANTIGEGRRRSLSRAGLAMLLPDQTSQPTSPASTILGLMRPQPPSGSGASTRSTRVRDPTQLLRALEPTPSFARSTTSPPTPRTPAPSPRRTRSEAGPDTGWLPPPAVPVRAQTQRPAPSSSRLPIPMETSRRDSDIPRLVPGLRLEPLPANGEVSAKIVKTVPRQAPPSRDGLPLPPRRVREEGCGEGSVDGSEGWNEGYAAQEQEQERGGEVEGEDEADDRKTEAEAQEEEVRQEGDVEVEDEWESADYAAFRAGVGTPTLAQARRASAAPSIANSIGTFGPPRTRVYDLNRNSRRASVLSTSSDISEAESELELEFDADNGPWEREWDVDLAAARASFAHGLATGTRVGLNVGGGAGGADTPRSRFSLSPPGSADGRPLAVAVVPSLVRGPSLSVAIPVAEPGAGTVQMLRSRFSCTPPDSALGSDPRSPGSADGGDGGWDAHIEDAAEMVSPAFGVGPGTSFGMNAPRSRFSCTPPGSQDATPVPTRPGSPANVESGPTTGSKTATAATSDGLRSRFSCTPPSTAAGPDPGVDVAPLSFGTVEVELALGKAQARLTSSSFSSSGSGSSSASGLGSPLSELGLGLDCAPFARLRRPSVDVADLAYASRAPRARTQRPASVASFGSFRLDADAGVHPYALAGVVPGADQGAGATAEGIRQDVHPYARAGPTVRDTDADVRPDGDRDREHERHAADLADTETDTDTDLDARVLEMWRARVPAIAADVSAAARVRAVPGRSGAMARSSLEYHRLSTQRVTIREEAPPGHGHGEHEGDIASVIDSYF